MSSFDTYIASFVKDNPTFGKKVDTGTDIEIDSQEVIDRFNLLDNPKIPKSPSIISSGITRHATAKPGDMSKYTPYFDDARVFMGAGRALDETRARNQTAGQLWKGAASQAIIGHMIGGTFENIGYLIDIPAMAKQFAGTEHEWGQNFLSTIGHGLKEWVMEDYAPVHQTRRAEKGGIAGMADRTWWASHAPSIFTSLSLMVPTFGMVKGVSALGKALKIGTNWTKQTKQWVGSVGAALTSRHMYSTTESVDNYNQHYELGKSMLGLSEEEAISYASESAAKNYRWGYANLWKDILAWRMLLRYPAVANRALQNKIDAGVMKRHAPKLHTEEGRRQLSAALIDDRPFKPIHLLYHALLEGVEEYNIQWQKKEGKRAADIKHGFIPDSPYETLLERIVEHTSDPHTFDSFFWGTMGGLLFGGVGSQVSIEMFKSNVNKEKAVLQDLERRVDFMHTNLKNIVSASKSGNTVSAEIARSNVITGLTLDSAARGTLGIDIEYLKNMSNLSQSELQELGFTQEEVNIARELSSEVEQAGKLYDKLSNRTYGHGEKDAYIVAHLFSNTLKHQHINNIIFKEQSKLNELLAEREKVSDRKLSDLGKIRQQIETGLKVADYTLTSTRKEIESLQDTKKVITESLPDARASEYVILGQLMSNIEKEINRLEGYLGVYDGEVDVLKKQLNELNEKEKLALENNTITQHRLRSDKAIIKASDEFEINSIQELLGKLKKESDIYAENIDEVENKQEQQRIIKDVDTKIQQEQKRARNEFQDFVNEATTVNQVNALNREHDNAYNDIAQKRIKEIEEYDARKAKREELETPIKTEETKEVADKTDREKRADALYNLMLKQANKFAERGIDAGLEITPNLKRLVLEDPSSELSDVANQTKDSLEELKVQMDEVEKGAFEKSDFVKGINNILDIYEQKLSKLSEQKKETLEQKGESKLSNEIKESLDNAKDITGEIPKTSQDLLSNEANDLINIVNDITDKVERYLEVVLEGENDTVITYDTMLNILRDRNDNSLKDHYLTVYALMSYIRVLEGIRPEIKNKFDFSDFYTLKQVRHDGFLGSWLKRNEPPSTSIQESLNQSNHDGISVYIHDLQEIEVTASRTRLTEDQQRIIENLNNVPVGSTVKIITNPEHVDERYSKRKLAERNKDKYRIPVEIQLEQADGTRQRIGFINELYTTHHDVIYVNDKKEFSHFSQLLNKNDQSGLANLNVLKEHIDVLKEIYKGNKPTIPNKLREVLNQVTSVNKEEIQPASPKAIDHIIAPIFHGVRYNYIDSFNPTLETLSQSFLRHYNRFKKDYTYNKSIRDKIVDQNLELDATVVHRGVSTIIAADEQNRLDKVIKPVDLKDGEGKRIVLARTTTRTTEKISDTLFDIKTGNAVKIDNPHVVTKAKGHTGFFVILEPYEGIYQAFPVYNTALAKNPDIEYSKLTTDYVTDQTIKLLDAVQKKHRTGDDSEIRHILGHLSKVVPHNQRQEWFKYNTFKDGTSSILFTAIENNKSVYYDLRYDKRDASGNNMILRKSDKLGDEGGIAEGTVLGERITINKKSPEKLKQALGNLIRRININSDSHQLQEGNFTNPSNVFIDPVTGNTYSNYFDYLIKTNALVTTVRALTGKGGEIISNYNPAGRIKSTFFVKHAEQKAEILESPNVNINDIAGKTLSEYANMLPELKNYSILFDILKENNIDLKLNTSNEIKLNPDTKQSIYAEIESNNITVYKDMFKLNNRDQSFVIAHEILHSLIDNKIQSMSNIEVDILQTRLKNYINQLKNADLSNLTAEEKRSLDRFFRIVEQEVTETITFSFAHAQLPSILSKIQLEVKGESKQSFWQKLYEIMLNVLGIQNVTAIQELTNILNEVFDISDITEQTTEQQTEIRDSAVERQSDVIDNNIKHENVVPKEGTKPPSTPKRNKVKRGRFKSKQYTTISETLVDRNTIIDNNMTTRRFKDTFLDAELLPIC